ncbi:hypothetical protein [Arundinibacter roseus]|uniref:Uncharacterized protein n=1 Tax=Arundinibacter roseus TaxID=2070510 RepID=A0A4R4KIU2_9BACT|nr:hypothetical protein [Arundinibacter roseus]TDB68170.1 hypothetical protein EZE20_04395 [Arundinibacter roseus]
MNSKLVKTILLAATIGFFILWVLEWRRTDLSNSYWLLMLSLTLLLGHQYYRLKIIEKPASKPSAKPVQKGRTLPKQKSR